MDELLKIIVTNAPNFAGFIVLAWFLMRLVDKLTDALLTRIDALEAKVNDLAQMVDEYGHR